jgi:NAD(P)-dependent dehydrogenase (short-subunit alcohol dehydrogenase family)
LLARPEADSDFAHVCQIAFLFEPPAEKTRVTLTELIARVPGRIEAATAALPLPRAATPAEAATAYIYLMLNGYVTGQVLPVDGGGLLVWQANLMESRQRLERGE